MRVAILFIRFGPYHLARLEAAGQRLAERGDELVGIEVAPSSHAYAWDVVAGGHHFRKVTLFEGRVHEGIPKREVGAAVRMSLDEINPDAVVVPGWSCRESLAALQWALKHDVPAVMMSESARGDFARRGWSERIKAGVVRCCRAGLVGGQRHVDYMAELGMARDAIFVGYDAIDNVYFQSGADAARSQADMLRARHGLPHHYFLASSRFVPKKNLARLLDAYARYRAQAGDRAWELVLCGDGPLRGALEAQVGRLGLTEAVHFAGFVQYKDLPVYYGLASAFVHVSTVEQWGLVVNEAASAGLPLLVSHRCGCVPELVIEGQSGWRLDPLDEEAIAVAMMRVSDDPVQAEKMGQEAQKVVNAFGPRRFADGLAAAVTCACATPMPAPAARDRLLVRLMARR